MAFQNHTGWRRLVNATGYSWAGLKAAWRNEEAFRQESLLCAVLAPLALWLGTTSVERALLIGSLLQAHCSATRHAARIQRRHCCREFQF